MKKWKLVVGVLLVFATGILVGSFGTAFGMRYFFDRFKKDSQYRVDFIMGRLSRKLDLDAAQEKKIRLIVFQADLDMKQYWIKFLTETDEKLDHIKNKIKMQLNSDQAVRFEKLSEEIKARRRGHPNFFLTPAPVEQAP